MNDMFYDILRFAGKTIFGTEAAPGNEALMAMEHLLSENQDYRSHIHNPAFLTEERRMETVKNGQKPYALILCCADSRVPPEHIFSAGIGELFVLRNAGNLVGETEIASMEYAAEHLGTPLIVLMGHTHCGAVDSAMSHAQESGALGHVLQCITDAIGDTADPRQAERANLMQSLTQLKNSALLHTYYQEGKVSFAAAIYDIQTGKVEFLQA